MSSSLSHNKWKELRSCLKAKWEELTDEDLDLIDGRLGELEASLQKRYGWQREHTREEVSRFLKTVRFI